MKQPARALTVLTLLLAAFLPATAGAHQGDPNYRSEITSIKPAGPADGLEVEIQNFDDHVQLVNRTGEDVVIEGYDGEPYARLLADGRVEVNLNSPSHYLNEDRFANVELPARADADAPPEWDEVDDTGRFVWHDHRSHYMGEGIPSQVEDESKKTKVFDYTIPVTVAGDQVRINGTLTWVGDQSGLSTATWIVFGSILVLLLVAAVVISRRIRDRREAEDPRDRENDTERPDEEDEVW
jgi:hypothetical protein